MEQRRQGPSARGGFLSPFVQTDEAGGHPLPPPLSFLPKYNPIGQIQHHFRFFALFPTPISFYFILFYFIIIGPFIRAPLGIPPPCEPNAQAVARVHLAHACARLRAVPRAGHATQLSRSPTLQFGPLLQAPEGRALARAVDGCPRRAVLRGRAALVPPLQRIGALRTSLCDAQGPLRTTETRWARRAAEREKRIREDHAQPKPHLDDKWTGAHFYWSRRL